LPPIKVLEYPYGIKCDAKDKKYPEDTTFSSFTMRPGMQHFRK
jgi:hypothetical protein